MKYSIIFFFSILSFEAFAGVPKTLTFEEFEKMKVSVTTWYDIPAKDRKLYNERISCTPIEILVPLLDEKHPEFTKIEFGFELIKNGKVFLNGDLTTSPFKTEPMGSGSGCLPLDSDYRINVTYSYNPESGLVMCPPAYMIEDLAVFVKSAYNKPLKQDK